ncbi:MAG: glycosyltransferase [Candidatus Dojkabacteria bacterium]|nr:glycosyltransferase [Candidatus Dojkabacteria bacterium]
MKILKKKGKIEGGVDIFITVYNEPLEIIKETVKAAKSMNIDHKTYILDDGKSEEVKKLAEKLDVHYITRKRNKDYKAGNINNALTKTQGRFFAVFDADYIPHKNFLIKTLPFFMSNKVALVQTPQVYRNKNNLISRGASDVQKVFYEVIFKGKNKFNSVFWVGTNGIFRRKAIEEVGGIYAHKSEDLFTSYLLHQAGWSTIYISDILARGIGPDTLEEYHNQQVRWAGGGFHMFFKQNPLFKDITVDQKIQYLLSSTFYFSGIVIFLIMLIPILYLLFGFIPLNAPFEVWASHYIPFFLVQFVVILWITRKVSWDSFILSTNSFVAYIQALFNTLFSKEIKWVATGSVKKVKREKKPIDFLWVHIIILLLSIVSIPIGLLNIDKPIITAINTFWVLLNIILLGKFTIFNLSYKKNYK